MVRALLIAIIFLAPLPFGSARPVWQWLWLILIAGSAILLISRDILGKHKSGPSQALKNIPQDGSATFILLFLLGAWTLLQTYLAPAGIAEITGLDFPAWSETTFASSCYFVSYLILFYLAYTITADPHLLHRLVRLIVIAATIYSVYGFFAYISAPNKILWYDRWNSWSLSSTFVNRNSFAAYTGIGILCTSSLIAQTWRRYAPDMSAVSSGKFLYALRLFGSELWLYGAALSIMAVALLLSGSRAGIVSVLCAVSLFAFFTNAGQGNKRLWPVFVVLTLIAGGFLALSGEFFLQRLSTGQTFELRTAIYPIVIDQIAGAPFWGVGFGQFTDLFPLFRLETLPVHIRRAHNDYMEFLYTAGWPAFFALMAVFILLLASFRKAMKLSARNRAFYALGIAVIMQIGLHSLVDFPLQIPAIGFLFVILMGGIYRQSLQRRQYADSASP